jgi:predicted  nucleic acid-binding Zn-ribbon protein
MFGDFLVSLLEICMKFFNRFFLLLSLALASLFQNIQAIAADIPGYIGTQSFRLSDDAELNNLGRRAEDSKIELARAEEGREQIANQAAVLERDLNAIKQKMETLQNEAQVFQGQKKQLIVKLEELKKDPTTNAVSITETTAQIAAMDQAITERNKQAGQLKLESAPIATNLDRVRNDLNNATRRSEDARARLQNAQRSLAEYRQELINSIQFINREGARVGQNDGGNDGVDLARRLGVDRGVRDGQTDGNNQGTSAGQDRWYQRGADQGERDGSSRARNDGQRDGNAEGIVAGNRNAGAREGQAAGSARAQKSDAASVGSAQGKKAGLERAVSTGQVDGRNIGESETTKKLENGEMGLQLLNGAFAGSFARSAPSYPGDFNGQRFNPNVFQSKEILRKAYADGYVFNYREYTRYEFNRRVDGEYNASYDNSFNQAYNVAVNRDYPEYFDQGRRDADTRAYSRDYPVIKAEAYRIAFENTDSNPNRNSNEFKGSYTNAESSAYARVYEAIRADNFDRVEDATFNANIAAQTEIYRQKRIGEVSSIYNNNAVLKFNSSEMIDAGISGVASQDGIFQPTERTIHTIVLTNFGFKEAANVSVQVDGGALVKVPSIPARSVVTVLGAAEGKVAVGLGSTHKASLKVVSALNTKDGVEGRHFDRLTNGILKEADQKVVRVAYPIALTGMTLESELLKGQKNKLRVTATNNSKRAYKGELKIKLVTNSQTGIITKDFNNLSELSGALTLADAEVLVSTEQDVYRDLAISASIEQNGVKIGELTNDFITMARAQFVDKGRAPVIVVDSKDHLNLLLDVLSNVGGTEKVSVLDLSLSNLNSAILANGLSGKVLLMVDDANSTSLRKLNAFIGKSKSSTFVMVDENSTGLKNALSIPALKDATKLPLEKRQIVFTNPHRAEGVEKSSAFIQSSVRNFTADLELAQSLALTAPEMIAELRTKVTPATFATPNATIKLFSLKALAEVLNINAAYDESGGIFNRDKKWPEMIEKDQSLFMNQLRAASAGDVVESKLPFVLSAIAMKETISKSMFYADEVSKGLKLKIRGTTNDVLDDMEKDFRKSFKKNFKELEKKSDEQAQLHRPFYFEVTQPNS